MIVLKGNPVSPGIAMGHVLKMQGDGSPVYKILLCEDEVESEVARFESALARTTDQLGRIRDLIESRLGKDHSMMVRAHVLMLEDDHFSGETRRVIRRERVNAEWALKVVTGKIQQVYATLQDDYLREKIHDILDISSRLIRNLSGPAHDGPEVRYENVILVSSEINLSCLTETMIRHLKGFAADKGGWTSHISIIARSLKIPSVTHLSTLMSTIQTGQFVIVDGYGGTVHVDPDRATVERFLSIQQDGGRLAGPKVFAPRGRPEGLPGVKVYLNTEFPMELEDYPAGDVEGVGLFRSEFLCVGRSPEGISAREHEAVYRDLADKVFPQTANIRTFDIGVGSLSKSAPNHSEVNPAMGLRGIRLCLQTPGFFEEQLRGIIGAGGRGNLRVTLPFVSSVDEIRQVKEILKGLMDEARTGPSFRLPLGAMLEIPGTLFILDELMGEVDFFTLGTNDLVQFTLAMDRNNFDSFPAFASAHPAVRRSLERIGSHASSGGREVVCCGEMASHPFFLLILLGAGLRSVSVNRPFLPVVRAILEQVGGDTVRRFYDELSKWKTLKEIERLFLTGLGDFFPEPLAELLLRATGSGD